jgi:hypothetical protein
MMARFCRVCFVLMICLLAARPALARKVMIQDIVVTNSSTDLLLFLKVVDAFSPDIIDGVQNGLTATFNFDIRVSLERHGWPDKEVISRQVKHTLSYDTLKKEYRLVLSENGTEEVGAVNLEKAEATMEELNGVKLLALNTLEPDRQYVLKVRATLAKNDLPSYVNYLIPFSNFWNVHTDWFTVRFRY